MTDRIHSLNVTLEHDMRDDDAECIMSAIRMIRGVLAVSGNVSDPAFHVAEMRARMHLASRVIGALNDQ